MLIFDDADKLHWRILSFIWKQTDRSKPTMFEVEKIGITQRVILDALATGQYTIHAEDGDIKYFASWWMLDDEQLENALQGDTFPSRRTGGNRLFVTEASCTPGYMTRMVKAIRRGAGDFDGAWWNRPKNNKWLSFKRQRGNHV